MPFKLQIYFFVTFATLMVTSAAMQNDLDEWHMRYSVSAPSCIIWERKVACNRGTDNIPQFPNLQNDDKGNDVFSEQSNND